MKEADDTLIGESMESANGDLLDKTGFTLTEVFLEPLLTCSIPSNHAPAPHRDIRALGNLTLYLHASQTASLVAA